MWIIIKVMVYRSESKRESNYWIHYHFEWEQNNLENLALNSKDIPAEGK